MIRFSAPLVLAALPVVALLIFFSRVRLRELVLPGVAAIAIVLALAGLEVREGKGREAIWVLLDRSPSVTATTSDSEARDAVATIRDANPAAEIGAIAFSSQALVLSRPSGVAVPLEELPTPNDLGTGTDLEAAIRLALTPIPGMEAGHLVLATDGRITDGLTEGVLAAFSARVPVSTLPLGHEAPGDVRVVSLEAPPRVVVGRPFRVDVGIEAESPGEAALALYRDGELVASETVRLTGGGADSVQVLDRIDKAGPVSYRAVVRRPGDPIPQNDALAAYVDAGEATPLLLIAPEETADALQAVLAASQREFEFRPSVPPLEELAGFRTTVVTGFPFERLRADEIETLRSYVTDLGGGLFVAEGETELRGLREGGIEGLLPVSYITPQDSERASIAVTYILDRSGSMEESAGLFPGVGPTKIDVLRELTAASIGLLEPDAQVGVLAFDWDLEWIHPVAPKEDGRAIRDGLRTLRAGGGTDVYLPIVEALDAMKEVNARVKHILLVSDGRTANVPRDWEGVLARLGAQTDVHLSVIAVGQKPNQELLGRLSFVGRGSLLVAEDFAALPQVYMEATKGLLRKRFVDEEAQVSGALVRGDLSAIPAVRGHAVTYPRPTAEVLLTVAGDPLFARWRLGLGQVGVLNADLAGIWSEAWLSWSRASLLLETLLDAVEAGTWVPHGLRVSTDVDGTDVRIRVEAREPDGTLVNFLNLDAALVPGGAATPLLQTNVGFYEGTLTAPAEGGYALRVADRTRDRVARVSLSLPYSEEYRRTGVEEETLRAVAAATGGRFLEEGEELTLPAESKTASYRRLHVPLLLLSLSLFLLELGRRKLPRRVKNSARGHG